MAPSRICDRAIFVGDGVLASGFWSEAHIRASDWLGTTVTSDSGGDGKEDDSDLGTRELVMEVEYGRYWVSA